MYYFDYVAVWATLGERLRRCKNDCDLFYSGGNGCVLVELNFSRRLIEAEILIKFISVKLNFSQRREGATFFCFLIRENRGNLCSDSYFLAKTQRFFCFLIRENRGNLCYDSYFLAKTRRRNVFLIFNS